MKRKMNFGVIGLGRLGKIHTLNLLKIRDVRVKSVADPRMEEVKRWAKGLEITEFVSDWHRIIEDPEIDAVVIASPTVFHAEMIRAAVENGKNVFVEKPLSHNLSSAKELLNFLEDSPVKVQVAFNRRFDHNYRRVHDAILSGKIGKPYLIRSTIRDPQLPPLEFVEKSGGIFFDFFIHEFDNIRFITSSEVKEVYAGGNALWDERIGEVGDYDTAFAVLKMREGMLCVIDSSRRAVYGYDQRMEIFGSKGRVLILNDRDTNVETRNGNCVRYDNPKHDFQHRYADSFAAEIRDFVDCLINDKTPSVGPKDGYKAMLIAEAATQSAKENRTLKIEY